MKKNVKKLLALFLVLIFLAQSAFSLSYQGQKIPMKNQLKPEYIGANLMLPLRDTLEGMGATVSYDGSDKSIGIEKNGIKAKVYVGENKLVIGEHTLPMVEKIILKDGRTLISAEAVAQIMGVTLSKEGEEIQIKDVEKTPLNVAVINGPTGIAMAQMMQQNYLGENVKVQYEVVKNPQVLPAKLLKKEADIAFVPTNMAAILYNKSEGEIVTLCADIWGLLSIVTTDEKIQSWADLKGKQIDIFGQGATPEIAVKALLQKNGLDPEKDVSYKFSYDTPATLAAAVAGDQLKDKVAAIAEPFATIAAMKNEKVRVLYSVKDEWEKAFEGLGFPMGVVVVRKEFLQNHPEIIRAFERTLGVSVAYANNHPAEIGDIVETLQELPFKKPVVAKSIPRSGFKHQNAIEAKRALEQYLKTLFEFNPKTIGGKMPADDFYGEIKLPY